MLPQEIVGDIIELSLSDQEDASSALPFSVLSHQSRVKRLLSYALVSSTWSSEARLLLFHSVCITGESQARRFLSNPDFVQRRYQTKILCLVGYSRRTKYMLASSVMSVVGGVRGLQHLELRLFTEGAGLDLGVLSQPAVLGISSLTLADTCLGPIPLQCSTPYYGQHDVGGKKTKRFSSFFRQLACLSVDSTDLTSPTTPLLAPRAPTPPPSVTLPNLHTLDLFDISSEALQILSSDLPFLPNLTSVFVSASETLFNILPILLTALDKPIFRKLEHLHLDSSFTFENESRHSLLRHRGGRMRVPELKERCEAKGVSFQFLKRAREMYERMDDLRGKMQDQDRNSPTELAVGNHFMQRR